MEYEPWLPHRDLSGREEVLFIRSTTVLVRILHDVFIRPRSGIALLRLYFRRGWVASVENSKKPMANPYVILREEFDDWAVLFNPDADLGHNGFGLNPTGVYIWKLLDGEHSIDEMLRALRRDAADVPQEAGEQILTFVEELTQYGLATDTAEPFHDGREGTLPVSAGIAEDLPDGGREAGLLGSGMLRYEKPRLEPFTLERPAQGDCAAGGGCCDGSFNSSGCEPAGNSATNSSSYACHTTGTSASGGEWACGAGVNATGGGIACTTGLTAFGGSSYTCFNFGGSGGSCVSGTSA
jgi:SynChlorMet cassette protein ScmD